MPGDGSSKSVGRLRPLGPGPLVSKSLDVLKLLTEKET
jgi:hypothetical protein